ITEHPAPTNTYTLSLHDALPISDDRSRHGAEGAHGGHGVEGGGRKVEVAHVHLAEIDRSLIRGCLAGGSFEHPRTDVDRDQLERSEEHTSELQSRFDLVCRLLLE